MRIVVVGGTGLIGSRLVRSLRASGHDVIAASPSSGVNAVTGDGVFECMDGADVSIDVANSPSFEGPNAWEFFFKSGQNLIAAERASGVQHHITLSVVGTDRLLQGGYFRAKLMQEDMIRESGLPYTILRSTQFFEFMSGLAGPNDETQVVRLSPAMSQPIAADDVVAALAKLAIVSPANATIELAGPRPLRLSDVVGRVLAVANDDRLVIADRDARYFGIKLDDSSLVPGPNPWLADTSLESWLARGRVPA